MIGLIARADSTGLGIQSKEFFANIQCKALVIDFQNVGQPHMRHILEPDFTPFKNQDIFQWGHRHNMRGDIPRGTIERFLEGVDTLFCMETPYDYDIFDECRVRGIKTILQLNYEFLDFPNRHGIRPPDLFAAPSYWNWDLIPNPKVYLPFPTTIRPTRKAYNTFVHIAGRHAIQDRNGTQTLLQALQFVRNQMKVIIHVQHDTYFEPNRRSNVELIVDTRNKPDYRDNYDGGILVIPRKYGGLCLPINEALSFGMPVITTDISPNNNWLPKEWLIPASHAGQIQAKRTIDYFEGDPVALAAKMDEMCDPDTYLKESKRAEEIAQTISWDNLRSRYLEVLKP